MGAPKLPGRQGRKEARGHAPKDRHSPKKRNTKASSARYPKTSLGWYEGIFKGARSVVNLDCSEKKRLNKSLHSAIDDKMKLRREKEQAEEKTTIPPLPTYNLGIPPKPRVTAEDNVFIKYDW